MQDVVDSHSIDVSQSPTLNVISLFSCCGGMDLGFQGGFEFLGKEFGANPFRVVHASDISKPTTVTYNHNFSHSSECLDINDLDVATLPEADVVIGGFPCQPFSLAGKRGGFADVKERGMLYLQMKRVIEHVKPKVFIAENVDGLRSAKNLDTDTFALNVIIDDFSAAGYDVEYRVLKAPDYGVPQTRVRIIIIGVRKDLNISTIFYPAATHSKDGANGLPSWLTTADAIDDLWELLDSDAAPANHTSKDYSKAKFYPGKKHQGNAKERADQPARTVRAEAHGNQYAHYNSLGADVDSSDMTTWRRLTVRECARLQTFPDNFVFPVAQSEAHKQIGNAVPPVLAWHVARAVVHTLLQTLLKGN